VTRRRTDQRDFTVQPVGAGWRNPTHCAEDSRLHAAPNLASALRPLKDLPLSPGQPGPVSVPEDASTPANPRPDRFSWTDLLWWKTIGRLLHPLAPAGPAADWIPADAALIAKPSRWQMTWIGHASVLLQLDGKNVMIDPVFSPRIFPLLRRRSPPGLTRSALPQIDALLITHNHRDHLDDRSVRGLPRQTPVVVPPRLGPWFCRRGFDEVIELDWWEQVTLDGLQITAVPARHWSRRGLFDTNRSGWCGYLVRSAGITAYHAGDTGWFDGFQEIAARQQEISLALLPVGGNEPVWLMEHHHLTPEQAGEAFLALRAKTLIPIHWGTFRLSDEPLRAPIRRLLDWWTASEIPPSRRLIIPTAGAQIDLTAD
jgi:L-ascorbate metabolism protein UlaG (beta-lactamase superfamily)